MRSFVPCLVSIPFAALSLAASAERCPAEIVTVYVFDFDYSINRPGEGPIQDPIIHAGDTVRWLWLGDFHTVTSCIGNPEVYDSGIFDSGDSFEQQFDHPGTWSYYCVPHGVDLGNGTAIGMAGTITVLPAPGVLVAFASSAFLFTRRHRR